MSNLPGDWTTRGTVIVATSEISYGANELSRVEILRDVARMIQAGQTVVYCGMVTDTRRATTDVYRTSLVIRGEHRGEDYATRRAASVACVGSMGC